MKTVKNQSNAVVAEYTYNGLNMRIGWRLGPGGNADANQRRGSSYIHSALLRNRDANTSCTSAQGGTPNSGEPTVEGSASAVVQGGQPGSPEGGVIITPPGWTLVSTYKIVWDGWLLIGELDGQDAVVRTCAWGLTVSGSPGGAGDVGGLAFESLAATRATHLAFYDGNENLTSLRDDTGAISVAYEYGPFGDRLSPRNSVLAHIVTESLGEGFVGLLGGIIGEMVASRVGDSFALWVGKMSGALVGGVGVNVYKGEGIGKIALDAALELGKLRLGTIKGAAAKHLLGISIGASFYAGALEYAADSTQNWWKQ